MLLVVVKRSQVPRVCIVTWSYSAVFRQPHSADESEKNGRTIEKGQKPSHKGSCVSRLLLSVDVPNNVVGQTNNTVAGTLGHFGEAFCFRLVLEGVAREVDS